MLVEQNLFFDFICKWFDKIVFRRAKKTSKVSVRPETSFCSIIFSCDNRTTKCVFFLFLVTSSSSESSIGQWTRRRRWNQSNSNFIFYFRFVLKTNFLSVIHFFNIWIGTTSFTNVTNHRTNPIWKVTMTLVNSIRNLRNKRPLIHLMIIC